MTGLRRCSIALAAQRKFILLDEYTARTAAQRPALPDNYGVPGSGFSYCSSGNLGVARNAIVTIHSPPISIKNANDSPSMDFSAQLNDV